MCWLLYFVQNNNPAEAGRKYKIVWSLSWVSQLFPILQGGSVPPATSSRLSPLSHEPADFYNVDIPLESSKV
jgi:hypothetical protein